MPANSPEQVAEAAENCEMDRCVCIQHSFEQGILRACHRLLLQTSHKELAHVVFQADALRETAIRSLPLDSVGPAPAAHRPAASQ